MPTFERIAVSVLLLLATGAGQAFLARPLESGDTTGQPATQIVFGLLYLLLAVFLVPHRTEVVRLLVQERWTALLCLWALCSAAWSVEPAETLRRALALAGTSLAGLYMAARHEPRDQLERMARVLGIGAVASLLVVLFLPAVGTMSDGGFQGVYHLKNSLGRMMSFGAFAFALLALGERRRRMVRAGLLLLCCVLLVLSRSATAVVVTLLMLGMLTLRRLLYVGTRRLVGAAAVLLPLAGGALLCALAFSDEILRLLGRTSSLSGRIPLWNAVLGEIALRPMQGYGFTAFWASWPGQRVSDSVKWDLAVPHAHNGFLEVWLGLGLVGLGMMLVNLARNLRLALRVARDHREPAYSWPLMLVLFTVLYNLTETSLLGVNSMPWMAYSAVSYWLAGHAAEPAADAAAESGPAPAFSS